MDEDTDELLVFLVCTPKKQGKQELFQLKMGISGSGLSFYPKIRKDV